MPDVSIIIPVYNVEKYLCQCLDSVVNQSLKNIEIICIDDGSTDASSHILDEYTKQDNRIKVIHKDNTGYGCSMNIGLRAATGTYIGIVESDDFASFDMFSKLFDLGILYKADVVKSNYMGVIDEHSYFVEALKNVVYDVAFSAKEHPNILHCPPAIWSGIYRRDFLLHNNIFFNETPGASYQDTSFNFKALIAANRIYLTPKAFLHYRMDNINSSVHSKGKVYCICDEYQEIWRYINEHLDKYSWVKSLYEYLKYKSYIYNYTRLADEYKLDFLQYISKEFQKDKEIKLLDKSCWNDNEWNEVHELIRNVKMFYKRKQIYTQQQTAIWHDIIESVRYSKQVFVYGAGAVGTKIAWCLLEKFRIKVKFCVTSIRNDENMTMNIPICEFKNIDTKFLEEAVFLIAIKNKKDSEQILKKLHDARCKNVFAVGDIPISL